jgi:hypothetical protein
VLAAGAPAQPAAALPGFKKDLTPRNRRLQIPESAFSEGPEGIKFYDTVVGDGDEAVFGDRVAAHVDVKLRGVRAPGYCLCARPPPCRGPPPHPTTRRPLR